MQFFKLILVFVAAVTATSHDTFAINTRFIHDLRQSRLSRQHLRRHVALLVHQTVYNRPQIAAVKGVFAESRRSFNLRLSRFRNSF